VKYNEVLTCTIQGYLMICDINKIINKIICITLQHAHYSFTELDANQGKIGAMVEYQEVSNKEAPVETTGALED
jgi:hypothetical protein